MRSQLVALVCLLALGELVLARAGPSSHEWSLYKRQFKKNYASAEEEARRFANFLATKARVERHNANATHSYRLGLNHMADWSQAELARVAGRKMEVSQARRPLTAEQASYLSSLLDDPTPLPDAVDWRNAPGRVGAVKDQGGCDAGWAFATAGVLEGQQLPRNISQELIELSSQDLLDCSTDCDCQGGLVQIGLREVAKRGGIMSAQDYPYVARRQSCGFHRRQSVMTDVDAIVPPYGDELGMKRLVARYGPVSAAMLVKDSLKLYSHGIYDEPVCSHDQFNHNVLIVGYGTDAHLGDFWIVKNSWSIEWGEQGYFRIKRGVNMCGIGSIPTIAKF